MIVVVVRVVAAARCIQVVPILISRDDDGAMSLRKTLLAVLVFAGTGKSKKLRPIAIV